MNYIRLRSERCVAADNEYKKKLKFFIYISLDLYLFGEIFPFKFLFVHQPVRPAESSLFFGHSASTIGLSCQSCPLIDL